MLKDFEIDVCLKTKENDVFKKSYKIALWEQFVNGKEPKEHNFANHLE